MKIPKQFDPNRPKVYKAATSTGNASRPPWLVPSERLIWWDGDTKDKTPMSTAYADRLYQFDPEKYNRCAIAEFGKPSQAWDGYSVMSVTRFLKAYFEDDTIRIRALSYVKNSGLYYRVDYVKEVKRG